jgi:hypothetical protein
MHCEVHRVQSRWKRFKSRWRSLVRLQAFKQLPDTQFHKESLHVFDQPTFEVPFPHFGVESKEVKIIGVLEELVR